MPTRKQFGSESCYLICSRELDSTIIHCDNHSCIKLSENPVFHDRSKHIKMRYYFIKDLVQRGALKLQYIRTDEQIANILTKPLTASKFVYFCDKLGMAENASLVDFLSSIKSPSLRRMGPLGLGPWLRLNPMLSDHSVEW